MMRKFFSTFVLSLLVSAGAIIGHGQSTAFSYQGSLKNGGLAANGSYDFEFALFDADNAGAQVGSTISLAAVTVTNGIFSVQLDFGDQFPGASRFLEVRVRAAGGGAFSTLAPRQQLVSVPYAVRSLTSELSTNASQLAGVAADQYVLTTDPRMNDSRNPLPGSASYIQNATSQQGSSNFNISGNGTAAGTLRANSIHATSEIRFGPNDGFRLLSSNASNLYLGFQAGLSDTGSSNTFVGNEAGVGNTTGMRNSFFGRNAGRDNTIGVVNTFVGDRAGQSNTTGSNNSFVGSLSGAANTTGTNNSFFGVVAGYENTSGSHNSFFGTSAGSSLTTGFGNSAFGSYAGSNNVTGDFNSVFGYLAGRDTSAGFRNTFVGRLSGATNTTGSNNSAFGADAGVGAVDLTFATAIGAGSVVSTSDTVVLGRSVDTVRVPGLLNVSSTITAGGLIESTAGGFKFPDGTTQTTAATGSAGVSSLNSLIGNVTLAAGTNVTITPSGNTLTISSTGGGSGGILNQTTLQTGANFNIDGTGRAAVFDAGSYWLGNVPIISASDTDLNLSVGQQAGGIASGYSNTFVGQRAGRSNAGGFSNSFFGETAGGDNTTGARNSFFGEYAGEANTIRSDNSYFGYWAGRSASNAERNSYFGSSAGKNASGNQNAYFGWKAGENSSGSNNAYFGVSAGTSLGSGSENTFFGFLAGELNSAGANNVYLGSQSGKNSNGSGNVMIGRLSGAAATSGNSLTLVGNGADVSTTGLSHATAIGAGSTVSTSNTIALGRSGGFDDVVIYGGLILGELSSTAGATAVCRNAANQLAPCGASSLRYKTNVSEFTSGLSTVRQLRPVSFDWLSNGTRDIGLVAEDTANADPLLTFRNKDGAVEGVRYDRINIVLINAVKEQQVQIEKQNDVIRQQADQITALKEYICGKDPAAGVCRLP